MGAALAFLSGGTGLRYKTLLLRDRGLATVYSMEASRAHSPPTVTGRRTMGACMGLRRVLFVAWVAVQGVGVAYGDDDGGGDDGGDGGGQGLVFDNRYDGKYKPGYGTTHLWDMSKPKEVARSQHSYKRPEVSSRLCIKSIKAIYRTVDWSADDDNLEQQAQKKAQYMREQCMGCSPTKHTCEGECEELILNLYEYCEGVILPDGFYFDVAMSMPGTWNEEQKRSRCVSWQCGPVCQPVW